ncbi:hypothetical protein ROA7450_03068 [Roseovarius albus]|uniref:Uncharacterized protein n=1 Tax=Roseovarius albus TaxID=1247867 RepID=A0A1X6ZRP0_9RHOB|nr:hypothetical protein [Roseovarius albus]SLN59293.1 hypothetical protein ROA7450_03068 [Roseovarius albus]
MAGHLFVHPDGGLAEVHMKSFGLLDAVIAGFVVAHDRFNLGEMNVSDTKKPQALDDEINCLKLLQGLDASIC